MNLSCRICFEDLDKNDIKNNILSPCNCRGTLNYVHEECFNNYIKETNKVRCEICKIKYPNYHNYNNHIPPNPELLEPQFPHILQLPPNFNNKEHILMLYHYLLQIINIVFVSMKIKPLSEKIGFIIEYLIIAFISFIIVLLSMLYGYIEPFTIKCNLDNTIKKIATIIFRYIFKIGYYYKHFITNFYIGRINIKISIIIIVINGNRHSIHRNP